MLLVLVYLPLYRLHTTKLYSISYHGFRPVIILTHLIRYHTIVFTYISSHILPLFWPIDLHTGYLEPPLLLTDSTDTPSSLLHQLYLNINLPCLTNMFCLPSITFNYLYKYPFLTQTTGN